MGISSPPLTPVPTLFFMRTELSGHEQVSTWPGHPGAPGQPCSVLPWSLDGPSRPETGLREGQAHALGGEVVIQLGKKEVETIRVCQKFYFFLSFHTE